MIEISFSSLSPFVCRTLITYSAFLVHCGMPAGIETEAGGRRKERPVQPADIGWPTGNGMKLSNSQACCLAQLCLAAA